MSEYQENLKQEFQDEEYRYAYAEDFSNTLIATQIRVLREQRDMSQQDLADRIGTAQAGISRLENVNYSAWKTATLRKLARALGVRLRITFETFGSLVGEAEKFSRKSLMRPEFHEDPKMASKEVVPNRLSAAPGNILIFPFRKTAQNPVPRARETGQMTFAWEKHQTSVESEQIEMTENSTNKVAYGR